MVDVNHIAKTERAKMTTVHMFHDSLQSYVQNKNSRQVRILLNEFSKWIGLPDDHTHVLQTIEDEMVHASAVQKGLLSKQKTLFIRLQDVIAISILILNESKLDIEELINSEELAELNAIIELIQLNSKEVVSVPGGVPA